MTDQPTPTSTAALVRKLRLYIPDASYASDALDELESALVAAAEREQELRGELAHARDMRNAVSSMDYLTTCVTVERDALKAQLVARTAEREALRAKLMNLQRISVVREGIINMRDEAIWLSDALSAIQGAVNEAAPAPQPIDSDAVRRGVGSSECCCGKHGHPYFCPECRVHGRPSPDAPLYSETDS